MWLLGKYEKYLAIFNITYQCDRKMDGHNQDSTIILYDIQYIETK